MLLLLLLLPRMSGITGMPRWWRRKGTLRAVRRKGPATASL